MLTFDRAQLAAINQKLQTLSSKQGKTLVRSAARAAMKPVRDQVQRTAPEDLEDDDGIKVKANVGMMTKWRGDTLYVKVGIKGGAKKNPNTPYYWRMHEFGTQHMPARPFMGPALEANAQQVLDVLAEQLKKKLFGE